MTGGRAMKVLVFTHHYPSTRLPTMAPYSYQTYRALARRCEVRLVAPTPWWTRARGASRELLGGTRESHTGIDALFPTYWSVPGLPVLHARAIHASLRGTMAALRREFPYDAILAAWAYPDTVAAEAFARGAGVPVVTTVLGSDINEQPRSAVLRAQIAPALQRCARVVAVSGALGDRLVELGVPRERVVVQLNAVDGERFTIRDRAAPRARLGVPADARVVLYAGYHVPEKGVDVLVEAMAHLDRTGRRDVHLMMVGGGELLDPLRARVSALGLGDRVQLFGWALPAEIPDYMAACDVFCLPSRREGCPNVVLEALASGRPVVATRVGGVPELVREGQGGNGLLVPAGDPQALGDALVRALEQAWDPEALRGSVGALSWDVVGQRYHALLEEVLRERGGAG
ncbi:glycosyltransferase family 4 protein (plasmid) [Sorangium sp. So ce119]|uniref:glycosyltransferase family 4 protein n=1 Tax=Sorangium sp. So ce119 TaxID=3133279 RepID=UPI003F62A937